MASRVWNPTSVYITDVVGAKVTPSGLIIIITNIERIGAFFYIQIFTIIILPRTGFGRRLSFQEPFVIDELELFHPRSPFSFPICLPTAYEKSGAVRRTGFCGISAGRRRTGGPAAAPARGNIKPWSARRRPVRAAFPDGRFPAWNRLRKTGQRTAAA